MNLFLTAALLAASWSGSFSFGPPSFRADGTPVVAGTVNVTIPGAPMYPVKTIFVPVPPGVLPELRYSAVASSVVSLVPRVLPRAPALSGSGLDAVEVQAEPLDYPVEPAVFRGVFPLAGTNVAVIDIHPFAEDYSSELITIDLSWNGGGPGVPLPNEHLLAIVAQGEVYWPQTPSRASSPFWGKPWARISLKETGCYRISAQQLESAECAVTGVPIETLALYGGPGAQFSDAPEAEHQLRSIPIRVFDTNGNGVFDENDHIEFIGIGLNRFEFPGGSLEWLFHRYASHNVYWLTWGGAPGARMESLPGIPDGSPEWGASADHTIRLEDGGYWMPRYEKRTGWFWMKTASGGQLSVPFSVPGISGSANVALGVAVTEPSFYQLSLEGGGTVELSGSGFRRVEFQDVSLAQSGSLLIGFSSSDPSAELYLDYVELGFPSQLISGSRFFLSQNSGRFTFSFQGGESVFDLTDPMNPRAITGAVQSGGGLDFSYTLTDSSSLMAAGESSWMTPDSITPAYPGRLLGTVTGGDRLLVIPPEFQEDVTGMEALLQQMGLVTVTATTREIYDEFGQGLKDPGAIRSAVRWSIDSWNEPCGALILCGDSHYDPLGYNTHLPDLIPAMIHVGGSSAYPSWAVEDWFAIAHQGSVYPEIPVARIPASNRSDLGAVTAKSVLYQSGAAAGDWSSRFVLFADDEWGGHSPSETEHTVYMEAICYEHLPPWVKPEKFYLIEFPWPPGTTPDGVHPEKPEAREAFLDLWNRGMGVMLFFGHGSPNQIAHEKVMLGGDPASLTNGGRLPLAMFLSCDVSRFFMPGNESIGEKLVYHPAGGAIATIGATGGTTAPANFAYASEMTQLLTQGGNSMGQAFWAAKLTASAPGNSAFYVYLGLPDLVLAMSSPSVSVSVDGDTLFSGEANTIQGTGSSQEGLSLIEIRESDIPWQYTTLSGQKIDYFRQGGTAWRGRATLSSGSFFAECFIPVSSYTGDLARVDAASVVHEGVEIGANAPSVMVSGNPPDDDQGPEISMWISGQREKEEPVITGPAVLEAELGDPSGITFLGRTGGRIRLFINTSEYDVSDYFSYNTGSTTIGTLQYPFQGLGAGTHLFILRAMDGVGNISSDTLSVISTDPGQVAITQHIVYPNPGTGIRCFSFNLSADAHTTVSIFTIAGRRINTISSFCPQGYNQIVWSGLDADGDIPSSGTYIYRIEAQTENGLFIESSSVTGVFATMN